MSDEKTPEDVERELARKHFCDSLVIAGRLEIIAGEMDLVFGALNQLLDPTLQFRLASDALFYRAAAANIRPSGAQGEGALFALAATKSEALPEETRSTEGDQQR